MVIIFIATFMFEELIKSHLSFHLHSRPDDRLMAGQTCRHSNCPGMLSLGLEEIWRRSSCCSNCRRFCVWQFRHVYVGGHQPATAGHVCHSVLSSHTAQAFECFSSCRTGGTSPPTAHYDHRKLAWCCSWWLSSPDWETCSSYRGRDLHHSLPLWERSTAVKCFLAKTSGKKTIR